MAGDSTVIIDGQPLARDGDKTACGAILIASQSTTIVDAGAGAGSHSGGSRRRATHIAATSAATAEAAFAALFFGDSDDASAPAPAAPQSATSAETASSQPATSSGPASTNLGVEVDALAAKSPTLQKQLADMQRKGIAIGYGKTGPSTTVLDGPTPGIFIDPA